MEMTIHISTQFHNCAFHVLVPYIAAFISPEAVKTPDFHFKEVNPSQNEREVFQKTQGYRYFLEAFAQYYQIENNATLPTHIKRLLEKFSHPLDLQILLGPVLRLTLKMILMNHDEHKAELKESFNTLLEKCAQKLREQFEKPQTQLLKILWLRGLQWDETEEYDEIFKPNLAIIAQKLEPKNKKLSKKEWDEAYRNICDYQCSNELSIFVTVDQLSLLCEQFNFGFQVKAFSNGRKTTAESQYLAQIMADNRTGDHWELVASQDSHWDYTKSTITPTFDRYHTLSIELLTTHASQTQIARLQNNFKEKIRAVVLENKDYEENFYQRIPSRNWAANGGMEGLISYLCDNWQDKTFQETLGFRQFLSSFQNYYLQNKLSTKNVLAKFEKLLSTYPMSDERFVILSPVLRLMLNSTREQTLTLEDLIRLHEMFSVGLELYTSKEQNKVCSFDKYFASSEKENWLHTVALTSHSQSWHLVEKDPLQAYKSLQVVNYATSCAFHLHFTNKSIAERLHALQKGISNFFKTEIPYIENSKRIKISIPRSLQAKVPPLHRLVLAGSISDFEKGLRKFKSKINEKTQEMLPFHYFTTCNGKHWTPLHLAIFFGKVDKAAKLLAAGANWRLKATWQISVQTGEKETILSEVSALEMAACLDQRHLVSLILAKAKKNQDNQLVQEAYLGACQFKQVKSLYPFLPLHFLQHTPQALHKAIEARDLYLVSILLAKGIELPSSCYNEEAIIQFGVQSALDQKEAPFSIALQNLLLIHLHEKRLRSNRPNIHAFQFNSAIFRNVATMLAENVSLWITHLISYLEAMPALLNREQELKEVVRFNIEKIIQLIAQKASKAAQDQNEESFKAALRADERCLVYPGKDNPLHQALLHHHYDFAQTCYAEYILDSLESSDVDEEIAWNIRAIANSQFQHYGEKACDQYERTLSFRLARIERKLQLYSALERASFFQGVKIRASLVKHNLEDAKIYWADSIFLGKKIEWVPGAEQNDHLTVAGETLTSQREWHSETKGIDTDSPYLGAMVDETYENALLFSKRTMPSKAEHQKKNKEAILVPAESTERMKPSSKGY